MASPGISQLMLPNVHVSEHQFRVHISTTMDSADQPSAMRPREANFADDAVWVLLEEIAAEVVFLANSSAVTQKLKWRIWDQITAKVNACGVAIQTQTSSIWRPSVAGGQSNVIAGVQGM